MLEPTGATAPGARIVRVLAVTNRKFEPETGAYGAQRTYTVARQALDVSIPPGHKAGEIEWPDGANGDAAKTYVTLARRDLDEARFAEAVRQQAGKPGEVLVFVHGFNTRYAEAVFRMAQISADSGFAGAHVVFSWPSQGEITGYLRDRESANFSRDELERLMRRLAATPGVRKIHLMAHSMGNWLAVEMLRQAKVRGDMEFGGKLGQVILASPDIDAQVFQSQADVIGPRNPPIIVFVSRNDRALNLSRRLAGDIPRVGAVALEDPKVKAAIAKNGMLVYDLSDVESSDRLNHGTFASAPGIIQNIGRQLNGSLTSGSAPGPGVFVLDAAGAVLDAPARVFGAVTGR